MSIHIIGGNGKDFNQINVSTFAPPTVDDEEFLRQQFGKPRAELAEEQQEQWDRQLLQLRRGEERLQSLMSKPDALGLPELLEMRRLEWRITDGAFAIAPLWDQVYIHQIETYLDGRKGIIAMTDRKKDAEHRTNPRGVIVAAGAIALDALRSNGCDLGHIVRFNHVNPQRLVVDFSDGKEFEVQIMPVSYVTGSEDLAKMLRHGDVRLVHGEDGKHRYVAKDGATFNPTLPWAAQGF